MRDTFSMLRYDSPAYQAHDVIIDDLVQRATSLNLLRGQFREDILGRDGIVCSQSRGSDRQSVSRSYFSLAISLERGTTARSLGTRELVRDVLAARLSIGERPADDPAWIAEDEPEPPYAAYREMIREFEEYCASQGIPSLLPNLFEPASLTTHLKDDAYDPLRPETAEMYKRLVGFLIYQDRHLHAVTTALQRRGGNELAITVIESAASDRGVELHKLFARNPMQADTYAEALLAVGRHADVASFCRSCREGEMHLRPRLVEFFLRAQLEQNEHDDVLQFLEEHHGHLPTGDPGARKAIGIACEQLGWWLYGEGRYDEAKAFLEKYARLEIDQRQGRTNMQTLYRTICEAVDA